MKPPERSTLKRGDIALVLYPYSDYSQVKKRPALVVQSDKINRGGSQIIVALITSNLQAALYPGRVKIPLNDPLASGTGLRTDSVIAADHLATVDMTLIEKVIGKLSDMTLVDNALRETFDL